MAEARIRKFTKHIADLGIDASLITSRVNAAYLTGLLIETYERFSGVVVCSSGEYALIVPKLDEERVRGFRAFTYSDEEGPAKALRNALGTCGNVKVLGIEGSMPIKHLWLIEKILGRTEYKPIDDVLLSLRSVKDDDEVAKIKVAVKAIEDALIDVIENFLKPNVTEAEVSSRIASILMSEGLEPGDILVQSGTNTAIPHAKPSRRRINKGDVVVIDVSARYEGYFGDLTRTVALGEPPREYLKIYSIVKEAHDEAIRRVKEGATAGEVDEAARSVITREGYGSYFIHRTGHGLGLEVHEEPYIVSGSNYRLVKGNVFTVEPGIYLPGLFGVRIESDVAVGQDPIILDKYFPDPVKHL